MNKISFVLKNPKNKYSAIVLLFTCHDGRLKYYTGEKATSKNWPDVDTGTDAQLDRIKKTIRELSVDYKIKGEPLTKAIVSESLDSVLHKKKQKSSNLFDAMRDVVEKMKSGSILTPKKKRYSKGSIKTFLFTVGFLEEFNPLMSIKSITLDTYRKFVVWCQEKDYSTNYIGSQIKNWKTLGKAVGGNPIFDDPAFKKIQEDTFDVYLDESELTKIFKLKLNAREGLTRDWFILDCFTGLRVSDLIVLGEKNYHKGFITIANEKTSEKVVIPAHSYVKQILEKHKGFPPPLTDVEINRTIKTVAKKAGITDVVLFTITKGGKRKDEYLQKWQMVSNHTARRSFITNLLKLNVSETLIMKLTGIKSHQTLKRYNKMSTEEAAHIMSEHSFFK